MAMRSGAVDVPTAQRRMALRSQVRSQRWRADGAGSGRCLATAATAVLTARRCTRFIDHVPSLPTPSILFMCQGGTDTVNPFFLC